MGVGYVALACPRLVLRAWSIARDCRASTHAPIFLLVFCRPVLPIAMLLLVLRIFWAECNEAAKKQAGTEPRGA
jgi:hypothetical protein